MLYENYFPQYNITYVFVKRGWGAEGLGNPLGLFLEMVLSYHGNNTRAFLGVQTVIG